MERGVDKGQISFQSEKDISLESLEMKDVHNGAGKNFKFVLFYIILFVIIFITNLIYLNAPNHNHEIYIEDMKNETLLKNVISFYQVVTRYSDKNNLYLKLNLNKNYIKDVEILKNTYEHIYVHFTFSINRLNFKIFNNEENTYQIPKELYEYNDLNLEERKIYNIEESNIHLHVDSNPFNFVIIRKDDHKNETLFDSRSLLLNNTLIFTKSIKRIYTRIPELHQFYGLEDQSSRLQLEKNKTYFLMPNNIFKENDDYNSSNYKNCIPSMPILLNVNIQTHNAYGYMIFSSSPIIVNLQSNGIVFDIFSGIIDFYIFIGPNPKEVIMALQKTIALPILPPFEALNWIENINKRNYDISKSPFGKLYVDSNYSIPLNSSKTFHKFIETEFKFALHDKSLKTKLSNIIVNTQNILENLVNENCNLSSLVLNSTIVLEDKYSSLIDFIKNSENREIINYFNSIPLYQIKSYFDYLRKQKISRPMIFSFNQFLGSAQYSGKWLGYMDSSFEGMKSSLMQTMKNNIFGNPHVVHESFGHVLDKDVLIDEEIYIRWVQMSSVFSHSRIVHFSHILDKISQHNMKILFNSLKLRFSLSLYIYSYFLKMSLEGGSLIRPLFLDLISTTYAKQLMNLDTQFMVGSNIMANPAFEPGLNKKSTFFSSDKFYDFYTGELMNPSGSGFYNVPINMDHISLYLKEGFITPIQELPYSDSINFTIFNDINVMKLQPIQLIIVLDSNFRSTGRILLDDCFTNDSITKKLFYKLEISASFFNNNFQILFHVNSFRYNPPDNYYPMINKITIYNYKRISIRKITILNKNELEELSRSSFTYDDFSNILRMKDLSIKISMETKIIIL